MEFGEKPTTESVVVEFEDELDASLLEAWRTLRTAQEAAALAEEFVRSSKAHLIKLMEERQLSTVPFEDARVTVVHAERIKVDTEALIHSVGRRNWNKMTKRVFDRKALEECLRLGTVDAGAVLPHIEIKQGDPYLRITDKA